MIHLTDLDVRLLSFDGHLDRKLLCTIAKANLLLLKIFENLYGVHRPQRDDFLQLDEEVTRACSAEISQTQFPQSTMLENFIAISQRMTCSKVLFIFHQPYLRPARWTQISRQKALDACKKYINDFSATVTDPDYNPYHWILTHFNVTHPCAIILQDLIQYPDSVESGNIPNVVDMCFDVFRGNDESSWKTLEFLRRKAWAANKWALDVQDDVVCKSISASLSDWDLFLLPLRVMMFFLTSQLFSLVFRIQTTLGLVSLDLLKAACT